MSSFKQTIINAIVKVTTDPAYADLPFATSTEARDHFITVLIAELFPEQPGVIIQQKSSPKPKEKKVKEPKAPKEPKPPKEKKVKEPKPPKEKKSKKSPVAPQPPTPAPTNNIMASVTEQHPALPPSPPSPKKGKKTAKPVFEGNLEKIDPTWRKWIKTAAKASKVEFKKEDDAKFLEWVNKMTKEEFEAVKNSADVSGFFPKVEVKSPAKKNKKSKKEEPKEETVALDLTEVEFENKTYFVNEADNRVYEPVGDFDDELGRHADYKPVGYMGEGKYKNMKIEEDE